MTMPETIRVPSSDFAEARQVPDGLIHRELARLDLALMTLDEALGVHSSRLVHVLPPDELSAAVAGRIHETDVKRPSPLADALRHAADNAERMADWVRSLTSTLEI